MRNEFTAVVEQDKRWYIAYCPDFWWGSERGYRRSMSGGWSGCI